MIGYTSLIYYIARNVVPKSVSKFTITLGEEKVSFEKDGDNHKVFFEDIEGTYVFNEGMLTFYKNHDQTTKGLSLAPKLVVDSNKKWENEIYFNAEEFGSPIKLNRYDTFIEITQDDGIFSSFTTTIDWNE